MEIITPFVLSMLTAAIVQVIKVTELVPKPERFMPLVSLAVGIGLGLYAKFDLFTGLMVGLSASGFYDLTKKSIAGKV